MKNIKILSILGFSTLLLLGIATKPVLAHHLTGGKLPSNAFEGLMSGLAHPIIGIDHFAFVVAVGLLASIYLKVSVILPLSFILATLAGTGLHLMSLNLPLAEMVIAASVMAIGGLLILTRSVNAVWLILGGAIAGLFHGYAYGEAIVGAQMTPLFSYLAGFAIIQSVIILIAYQLGKMAVNVLPLRFAGFTIIGVGFAYLSSALLG